MKKLLVFTAFCLFFLTAQSQKNFGKLVVGIETGFDVSQFTDGLKPRFIPGIQVEAPIGRFALRVGFARKIFHEYQYYTFTGQTIERIENEKPVTYFLADAHAFRPAYWSVPVSVQYRVHSCHCVFLHAGVAFDFFSDSPPERIVFRNAEVNYQPYDHLERTQLFKKTTRNYELGIGFNLFANDFFRVLARPSIVWSENPEIYTDDPEYLPTLRMTFGAQFAFFRDGRRR